MLNKTTRQLKDPEIFHEICQITTKLYNQKLNILGADPESISLLERELLLNYEKYERVSYKPICQQTGLLLFHNVRIAFLVSNNGEVYKNTGRLKLRGYDFLLIYLCSPKCYGFREQTNLNYDEYVLKYLSICKEIKGFFDKVIYRKPLLDKNPYLKEEDIVSFSWKISKNPQMLKYFSVTT